MRTDTADIVRDALSGKIGRIHRAGGPMGFVELIGPVGGTHYLVRDHGQTEMHLMTMEELRSYRFFDNAQEAGIEAAGDRPSDPPSGREDEDGEAPGRDGGGGHGT